MANDMLNKISQVVSMLTCVALVTLGSIRVWDEHGSGTPLVEPSARENPVLPGIKVPSIDGVSYE